jgi:hypothetical protein
VAAKFTRVFRNLAMCFPGTGSWQGPDIVSGTVAFTEPLFRPSVCQNLVFRTDVQSAATGGANTSLTHPEPATGLIHVPIQWMVQYDGGANILCIAVLIRTGNPFDPWGGWAAVNQSIGGTRVGSVTAGQNDPVLMSAFPYMRGHQLRANFPSPAAATNVISTLVFIEMPIELATIDTWKPLANNLVYSRNLP